MVVHNIGSRLVQAVSYQAEKAVYFCSAENLPANQKVHELRRGFKRLRALLRFYYMVPDSQAIQLQTDIRHFGKLLAPLRESAVNAELFEKEIVSSAIVAEKKIRNARELLAGKNKLLLEKGFWDNNLHNTIRTFFNGFDQLLTGSKLELPAKVHFHREICQTYLSSYIYYNQMPQVPDAGEWHDLRKKLKRLWYQLDFIRFLHPRYFKLKTDQLNKITDQLGDDHDLHVFAEDLLAGGYGFSEEELRIMNNRIENLREMNRLKLQPRLKQLFTAPPSEFEQKMDRFFKI